MSGKPTIAEAWVGILPSMDGFEASLSTGIAGASASVGSAAGTAFSGGMLGMVKKLAVPLLAVLGANAIFDGVGDAISGAITEASDLNESANAIKVTFGDAAGAVDALGRDAANSLGLSNTEFNNLAVRFSSFASTISGPGGDVAGTLDEMTTRAADFASVMNLDVADAAGLFQSGLAGETEPLRRYGIDLSAAAVEAFAMSEGIWDGTGAMSESQKVQARYASLMEQTSKHQGDFVNTSDELANSQRRLEAGQENASATLGTAFLPILETWTGIMADAMPIVELLAGFVKDMSEAFFEGQDAGEVFSTLLENLQPALDQLSAVFESDVIPALQEAGRVFIEDLLPALVQAAPDLAKLLALGIEMAAMWISDFLPVMVQVAAFVASTLVSSFQAVSSGIANVIDWFKGMANTAKDVVNNVVTWFSDMGDKLRTALSTVADNISRPFKNAFNAIARAWNNSVGKLGFTFPTWLPGAMSGAKFNVPDIAYLANGGVVTRPTLAMIGEGGQSEAVVPLDRAGQFGFGGSGGVIELGERSLMRLEEALARRMRLYADGREIAKSASAGSQLLTALGALT